MYLCEMGPSACSPQEAWVAFEAGRINRAQYEAQGLELVDSPELVCRLGKRLLPWRLAAPVLLGMAAFGCQLEALDAGVPVEVPQQLAGETKKVGRALVFFPFCPISPLSCFPFPFLPILSLTRAPAMRSQQQMVHMPPQVIVLSKRRLLT